MSQRLAVSALVVAVATGAVFVFDSTDPVQVTIEDGERPDGDGLLAPGSSAPGEVQQAGRTTVRGTQVPTERIGADRLFSDRLSFSTHEASGKEVLAVLDRYLEADFASQNVRDGFVGTRFPLSIEGSDVEDGPLEVLGADLMMRVRDEGYEIELRGDRLFVSEAARDED